MFSPITLIVVVYFVNLVSDDLIVYQLGRVGEDQFTCQYRINEDEWIEEESKTYSLDYQLEVITRRSPIVEPPKVDYISFQTVNYIDKVDEEGNAYTIFWNDYQPPTVTVSTCQFFFDFAGHSEVICTASCLLAKTYMF